MARNHAFRVGPPLSFDTSDVLPSALEHLLGAFASDVLGTFQIYARRARLPIDALELSLTCLMENPLVHLGVVGEEGSPRIERLEGTVYVSSDAEPQELKRVWGESLARSPLYATLSRACDVALRLVPTH
jgi:hypothetical protein